MLITLTLMLATYIALGRFERRLYYQTGWYMEGRSEQALRVVGAVIFPLGMLAYLMGIISVGSAHPDQREMMRAKRW